MLNSVEARLADPAFDEFRRRRLAELIGAGLEIGVAIRFASQETRGRAQISLSVGIERALDAELLVKPFNIDDDEDLSFRLLVSV